MNQWMKISLVGCATAVVAAVNCGGETPPVVQPEPLPSAPASAVPLPSAPPVASAEPVPTTAPTVPAPPPPKGTVHAFARSAQSGKIDKVGSKDGDMKPDGVKDMVFDLDYEGTVHELFVMTTDADGQLTSELDADTRTGAEEIPKDLAGIMNLGAHTLGLGVFEGGKLVNAKDGSIPALPEGRHKLTLHVSVKEAPKSALRVFVLNGEDRVVKGPILPAEAKADPKAPAKPADPKAPAPKPADPKAPAPKK